MTLKRTTEEVSVYFAKHNCKLIDFYTGCLIPMTYECECGSLGKTSWNNFTKGKRCGKCSKYRKRYTLSELRDIFNERGMVLLANKYVGNKTPLKYRCKCGRESKITLVALLYQQQSCKQCGLEKLRGENHPQWRQDRVQLREDQLFRKKIYKALAATLKAVGKNKIGRTTDILGYGPKELQEYVTKHSNWENVKNGNWHLDHIFPIQVILDYGIKDVKLINCLENLIVPVTQKENNEKKDKYDNLEFEAWLETSQ